MFNVENKFSVGDKVRRVKLTDLGGVRPSNGEVWEVSIIDLDPEGLFIGFDNDPEEAGQAVWGAEYFELVESYNPSEAKPPEVVALGKELKSTDWTDKHYDAFYHLTPKDIERGWIKIDPYRVSKQWRLGAKDESGALFHVLKTLARIGEKNSVEREVKALIAQIKCFAEIEGIEVE